MNELTKETKILIIGLGVIGGGYAMALKKAGFFVNCITKEQSDIDYAMEHGMIDFGTTELDRDLIHSSDFIIFALYPTVFLEWIKNNHTLIRNGAIVTDVCGVKSGIVDEVQKILGDRVEFIAAHPMAGRESSGVEFSDSKVFEGANFIVVPTDKNTEKAINIAKSLGSILGFGKISELSVKEHDKMIAFLSQLTHCIAVTLMTSNDSEGLEKYTGDSFRDLTRIAKINEKMWSELFLLNKDALLSQMDAFIKKFSDFKQMIEKGDKASLMEEMKIATKRRALFDKPKGN